MRFRKPYSLEYICVARQIRRQVETGEPLHVPENFNRGLALSFDLLAELVVVVVGNVFHISGKYVGTAIVARGGDFLSGKK